MSPKRFYYVAIGINVFLMVLILGVVYLGTVLIADEADKLSQAKVVNNIVNEQQLLLTQAKSDIEQFKDLNEISQAIVPQDKDQAKTVREISKFAEESGIVLRSITFNPSTLGNKPQTPATPPPAEGETPATPAAPTNLPPSQLTPADAIPGVFALPITIESSENTEISFDNLIDFLQKLESNRRTAHIERISIRPGEEDNLQFTIELNAYVKP